MKGTCIHLSVFVRISGTMCLAGPSYNLFLFSLGVCQCKRGHVSVRVKGSKCLSG